MEENRSIAPKEYTDKDMQTIARIAYFDFTPEMCGKTLGDIFKEEDDDEDFFNNCLGKKGDFEPGSLEETMYEEKRKFLDSLKTDPVYSKWKLVDIANYNEMNVVGGPVNGFCAILSRCGSVLLNSRMADIKYTKG